MRRWRPGFAPAFTLQAGADALVLAWEGEPVPEGLDRLRRVAWPLGPSTALWAALSEMDLPINRLLGAAGAASMLTTSRVVLLDAEGRELPEKGEEE